MPGVLLVAHLDGAEPDRGHMTAVAQAAPWRSPSVTGEPGALAASADLRLDDRPAVLAELAAAGHAVAEDTDDAAVVAAAYACWGASLVEHLEGDFALAIWDREKQAVLCARDPLGVRSLCWAIKGHTLVVASEPQQVAAHPAIGAQLDETALADHLAALCLDEERTVYRGVWRLPPGHVLEADRHGLRLGPYWDAFRTVGTGPADPVEAAEGLLAALSRSVRSRLRDTPAPVGIMLSGGLDSSSVAVLAGDLRRRDPVLPLLQPFSYRADTLHDCDESALTDRVAREVGVEVSWLPIELMPLLGDAAAFTPHPGWPFMAYESMDREALGRLQSMGGRRLLTGHVCRYSAVPSRLQAYAHRWSRGDWSAVGEVARMAREAGRPVWRELRRYLLRPLLPAGFLLATRQLRGRERVALPRWLAPEMVRRTDLEHRAWLMERPDGAGGLSPHGLRAPVPTGSTGRAVAWLDSLGARYGVEVAHPYLDRGLLEYLISLPVRLVYRDGRERVVIRDALAGLLPDEVRLRRDKTLFGSYHRYCMQGPAAAPVTDLLRDPLLGRLGFVDPRRLREAWAECRASGRDATMLWMTVTAEMWLRACAPRLGLDP